MVIKEEEDEKKKKEDEEEEERTKHGDNLTMLVALYYFMFIKWNSTMQRVLFIFFNSSTHPLFLNPHISKSSKIVNPNKDMTKVISHNCRIK